MIGSHPASIVSIHDWSWCQKRHWISLRKRRQKEAEQQGVGQN